MVVGGLNLFVSVFFETQICVSTDPWVFNNYEREGEKCLFTVNQSDDYFNNITTFDSIK